MEMTIEQFIWEKQMISRSDEEKKIVSARCNLDSLLPFRVGT